MPNTKIRKLSHISMAQMILFAFLCVYYSWVSGFFLYHNDIGWHLATGDLILRSRAIPATDPWSYHSQGVPWYNMAWLWDVLASLIFSYTGGSGLLACTIAIGVVTLCSLAQLALKMGARHDITLIFAIYVGLVFPFYAPPDIFLCIAPQQITLLFTALLLNRLYHFQATRSIIDYTIITLLFIMWCNMHGGFMIGHVMIALMLAVALAKRNRALAGACAVLLTWSLLAVLINPYGFHIIQAVRGTLGHVYQHNISEWKPLYKPDISLVFLVPSLFYCTWFMLALPQYRHYRKDSVFSISLLLLSVLLLLKGVLALRYFALFLLASIPVTSLGITRIRPEQKNHKEPLWPWPLPTIALLAGAGLYIMNMKNPAPVAMPLDRDPKAEIQYIEEHYPNARILNHWNFGSFLIYESHGHLHPFIDGRMGTAYPDAIFTDMQQLYDSKDWDIILNKHHIDVIIWPSVDTDMLAWFDHHPQWKKFYQGPLAVVLVKQGL